MAGDAANMVLGSIIEKMITPVVDTIGRHLGYLFFYKSNIKNLEERVDKLENTRKEVDDFCDQQKQNNIETTPSSAQWLREVETVIKKAKDVDINTSKLKGSLNLKGRYVMSRKSTKLAVVIQTLQKEVPERIATNIVLAAGRLPGAAANHYSKGYQTRMQTVEKIMKALEDDEISVIGICGLGGIGKTTIVHEVRERAMEQNIFQEFAMAIVSQNQELFKIQGDLAEMLGLTELKKEKNVIARADQLHKRLTNGNKVLVIFDDVWSDLNLKDIGVPFGSEQTKCKVIITSREEGVCNDTQRSITVQVLAQEEARALFRETAGEHVQKNNLGEIANNIADECGGLPIALLTLSRALSNKDEKAWKDTLTKLRRGNLTSIRGMEKQVYQSIKLSYDFLAVEKQEEAQWLLLICCQHQEDANISVEKLAQYCMSLDLFEDVTGVVRARNRVCWLIEHLKSCFLLQGVDPNYGDKEWRNEVVKVHDVVRDVCLSIMSRVKEERDRVYMHIMDQEIDNGDKNVTGEVEYSKVKILLNASLFRRNLTERFFQQMEDLRVLETSSGPDTEGIKPQSESQFPANLRMLCLQNIYIGEVAMQELTRLTKLESLSFLETKVDYLPSRIGQLSNLKLLDLRCHYSDQSHRYAKNPIPSGILPGLVKLEVLYMGNHHFGEKSDGPYRVFTEGGAEKRISELDSLLNLTTLQTVLLNPMALNYLQHLQFEQLETFYFASVGGGWRNYKNLRSWKTIELEGIGINWVLEDKMRPIVRSAVDLLLMDMKDFTDPKIMDQFASLRNLEMRNCKQLEYIIGDGIDNATHSGRGPCSGSSVFKNLESLKITKMSNVTELCRNGRLPEGSLCKLKELKLRELSDIRYLWLGPTNPLCLVNLTTVKIMYCSRLEFIFPHSATKCLAQLQYLAIEYCDRLKAIVCKGGEEKATGGREIIQDPNDLQIHFPKLRDMRIGNSPFIESFYNLDNENTRGHRLFNPSVMLPSLENLEFFSHGSVKSVFDFDGLGAMNTREDPPSLLCELQSIELRNLPKLEQLCRQVPKDVHIFKNLRRLKVVRCDGLTYLISCSVAHMLVNLQELSVLSCGGMKEVIWNVNEDSGEIEKKIVFRSLRSLILADMKNLSSFCSSDQLVLEFPALASVSINACPQIETIYCQIPRVVRSGMLEKNLSKGGEKKTGGGEIMEVPSDLVAQSKPNYVNSYNTPKLLGFNNIYKATGRLLPLYDSWPRDMPTTKEDIKVDGLDMEKQIVVGGTMQDFEQQDVMGENTPVATLPKLKKLELFSLLNLTYIFRCQLNDISFPELQTIYVEDCGSLVNVAASNLIKRLWNLREITLKDCESMTAVFDFEGLDVMGEDVLFILGALEYITLRRLPKVEQLCRSLPKEIHVFQHLKILRLENCGSMAGLIPSTLLHMLMNLQDLIVESCEITEEVVCKSNEEDGCGELQKKIVFHSLRSIELRDMKNLSSFCSSDQLVLKFPALESVYIYECPKMETFCCRLPRIDCSGLLEGNMSKGKGTTTEGELIKVPSDLVAQFPKLEKVTINDTYYLQGLDNCHARINRMMRDLKEDGAIDDDADHAAMEEEDDDVGDKFLSKNDVDESARDLTARFTQSSCHVRVDDVVDFSANIVNVTQVSVEGVHNEYDQCGSEALDHSGTSSSTPFDQGTSYKLMKAFPDASKAPVFVSPLPPVSDNIEDQAYSSICDLISVHMPDLIESVPSSLSEQSVPFSDSPLQKTADRKFPDLSFSSSDDDLKGSRVLIQGVYVKTEMKKTFEEILSANPNFLSGLRFKKAEILTVLVESAISSLQILCQHSADTISQENLASIKETLDDLVASGLDMAWLERGYRRASLVMKERKAVLAEAELADLERKKVEAEAAFEIARVKLEKVMAQRNAYKAVFEALLQEVEAGKEIFGGSFDQETSLGDGLL